MTLPSPAKLCLPLTILLFAVGCDKDENTTVANKSVRPNDFLSATAYKSLSVEIVFVDGYQPAAATVQNLSDFLVTRLNKPNGINIVQRAVTSAGTSAISVDLLKDLERTHRTENTAGTEVTAYFYFADAEYSGNSGSSKTLGVAYDYSSMAIFEKSVREFSGGVGKPSVTTLETAVVLHEFSHILGLVNNGTPLVEQHQDAAHQAHCNDQDCLMYYLAETSGIAANLFGGTVPLLDARCLADLKANGGK